MANKRTDCCPACNGTGKSASMLYACIVCKGEGKLWCSVCRTWGNHKNDSCPKLSKVKKHG